MESFEVAELVLMIQASWTTGQRMSEATARIYEQTLADLDVESSKAAVIRLIQTCKFVPTVAEIRAMDRDIRNGDRRTGLEAWGDVTTEIRRVGSYDSPNFKDPKVAEAVRCLSWRECCLGSNESATRARFVEAYDRMAERDQREEAVSPALRLAPVPSQRFLGTRRRREPEKLSTGRSVAQLAAGIGNAGPVPYQPPTVNKATRPAMTQNELEQERQRQRAMLNELQASEAKGTD